MHYVAHPIGDTCAAQSVISAERAELRHAVLLTSDAEQARYARTRGATRRLLEELRDVERTKLHLLENTSVVDNRLAHRLQTGP